MSLDRDRALESVLGAGDEWQSWRALRITDEAPQELPSPPLQDAAGGFEGPGGRVSPGATGEALCHLKVLSLAASRSSVMAADWLEAVRTPAGAWLDPPSEVPGEVEEAAAGRVWATAAAGCGLMAVGRDPGARSVALVGAEADNEGRFTGGTYPTFAAAGLFWLAQGPRTEMAEWALRWAREWDEDWWGPWELVTALIFWGAAGVPGENASAERFLDRLVNAAGPDGWPDDPELTLRALEVFNHFES
ncbi:MAG: hypothetical protein M3P18_25930 [Actinomycetota bacterium]|nr:hypothetical protein [Actinomycetota bacterium]